MSIKDKLIRIGSRTMLQLDKYSPQILVGVGIAAGVAATGLAIYSTTKLDSVMERHQDKMVTISKKAKEAEGDDELVYDVKAQKHDKTMVCIETGAEVARLYLPTIALTGVSVACILSAHHILDGRYTAAAAAFTAVSKEFGDYRDRVRAELGEDKERDIKMGIVEKTVTDENGETKTVREHDSKKSDGQGLSRWFDEYSIYWDLNNPDQNISHVRAIIHWANDKLHADGHLFLNDVYRQFDIPDTKEGAILGWVIDDDHPNSYVDFGVYGANSDDPWDFVNDIPWDGKKGILLDFNVDGIIYDRI